MRRTRTVSAAALVAALGLALAACTTSTTTIVRSAGSGTASAGSARAKPSVSASPSPTGPLVTITPGSSAAGADPSQGIAVSTADAETYYKLAVPGDPITISGSPRPGTWDNGWTEWFLSWNQLVAGSALHEAVVATPQGSTFVPPSALRPNTAKAPLGTAAAGNIL